MITRLLTLLLVSVIGGALVAKAKFRGVYFAMWFVFAMCAGSGAYWWGSVLERWRRRGS